MIIEQPQVILRGDGGPVDNPKGRFVPLDDPAAPARLQELIAGLGSADFRVREQASRNLEDDQGITLQMIEKAVRDSGTTLSLEARARLLGAARDRFWRTPRGALGIQFWNALSTRVVVEQTFREFEASQKIEDGDMIIEADGRPIDGPAAQQRLQAVIVSHDPGESIRLVVRRGEQKLNLEVRLGRREDLANAVLTDAIMTRAWQQRVSAVTGAGASGPITTGVRAADWSVNPVGLNRAGQTRRKGMDASSIGAVGGGMPRGAELSIDAISQRLSQGMVRNQRAAQQIIWQQNAWGGIGGIGWDPNAEPTAPTLTRKQELEMLLSSRAALVRDRERLDRFNPPVNPQVINRNVIGGNTPPTKTLEIIDKQVRALRAEMAEHGETLEDTDGAGAAGGETDKPQPETP